MKRVEVRKSRNSPPSSPHFPCYPVIHECLQKKTRIEKKAKTAKAKQKNTNALCEKVLKARNDAKHFESG